MTDSSPKSTSTSNKGCYYCSVVTCTITWRNSGQNNFLRKPNGVASNCSYPPDGSSIAATDNYYTYTSLTNVYFLFFITSTSSAVWRSSSVFCSYLYLRCLLSKIETKRHNTWGIVCCSYQYYGALYYYCVAPHASVHTGPMIWVIKQEWTLGQTGCCVPNQSYIRCSFLFSTLSASIHHVQRHILGFGTIFFRSPLRHHCASSRSRFISGTSAVDPLLL